METLARVTKLLHGSKTILLIQTLSQIAIRHFHKYETPTQIRKHLRGGSELHASLHIEHFPYMDMIIYHRHIWAIG